MNNDRHYTTPEELLEINAREQKGNYFSPERHYTTPEELLEINAREQKGNYFSFERHYTTPEELLEINAREQGKYDLIDTGSYVSLEETFGGPSDLQEKWIEKKKESIDAQQRRQEIDQKMERDVRLREEAEKYSNMPIGQKLYKELSYYAQMQKRKGTPEGIDVSKKVTEALFSVSMHNDFEKMHKLLEGFSDNVEVQEILPHWQSLVQQCEQFSKGNQTKNNNQTFESVKEDYKKSSWFNKIVEKITLLKKDVVGKGK